MRKCENGQIIKNSQKVKMWKRKNVKPVKLQKCKNGQNAKNVKTGKTQKLKMVKMWKCENGQNA